jgi:hypothetical protein
MSVADNIRALAREGLGIADIARKLGIRYQQRLQCAENPRQDAVRRFNG